MNLQLSPSLKTQNSCNSLSISSKEYSAGHFKQALTEVNKALREDPKSLQAMSLKAKCYISLNNPNKAVPLLLQIIQKNPLFSKEIYIELAKCFIDLNDYQTALRQLTRCLVNYPQFTEGYISRGTVHNKLNMWDNAVFDFSAALEIDKTLGIAYLGISDALKALDDLVNAAKVLENALKCPEVFDLALMRMGKLLFDLKEFDSALKDFEKVIETYSNHTEAYYYKSFCLLGLNNQIDAAVALEQVIKYDNKKQYTGAAIYNLGVIKIKQKDFFGAFYTFQRACELGLDLPEQRTVQQYVEAILLLIKRNFSEGAKILTKIIKKKDKLLIEYIGNCLEYRAYAYAFGEFHIKAVNDLQEAQKIQELEKASLYNLLISEGILFGNTQDSIEKFDKALILFNNIEPMVYKSALLFQESIKQGVKANESRKLLDLALKQRDNDSELFFFRAIVLYYNNKSVEAIYDLEKAIDKSEDNMTKHFLAKGCCSARILMYKEAIEDFNIGQHLDPNEHLVYLYRARAYYFLGELEKAYEDFLLCIKLKPSASFDFLTFLLYCGDYNEALKVAEALFVQAPSVETILGKVYCFIFLQKLDLVLKELKKCCKLKKSEELENDLEVFLCLQEGSQFGESRSQLMLERIEKLEQRPGNICLDLHKKWIKGILLMYQKKFFKARMEFVALISRPNKKTKVLERNTAELIYNISLCCYLEGNYIQGFSHLLEICNFLQDSDKGKVLLLVALAKNELNSQKEAKIFFEEALKLDPETVGCYAEEKNDFKILPLDSDSIFLDKFSFFSLKIGENPALLVKPSISLPRPSLKKLDFDTEPEILEMFTLASVKCKPETPYLNRVGGAIQFTEVIQNLKSDSDSESIELESSGSSLFSSSSLPRQKSLEIMKDALTNSKVSDEYDSSFSDILDQID